MKAPIARREFLRQMSRGFGLYALHSTLLDGLMGHILNAAYAQTTGGALPDPRVFYVHVSLAGGPPRWFFDLPLTPNGQTATNFKAGGFGTVLTKTGGLAGAKYESRKITAAGKSYWMPPVWGMNLKQHNFTNVFQNTLIMRGVDMEINNHALSNQRQISPVIGGYSLTGMVADATNCPLPSISDPGTSAAGAFRSKKGLATSSLAYPAQASETAAYNPVALTLAPFKEFRTSRPAHSPVNTRMGEQVLVQFETYAKGHGLTESAMVKMYDAALSLIDENVTQLGAQWSATVAKYRAIIQEALHPAKGSLPGLFDTAIPGNSVGNLALAGHPNVGGQLMNLGDLRDMVTATTTIPKMAENFAATEILLGKLCATATLNMPPPTGFQTGAAGRILNMTHDQHYMGSAVSTLTTTLFYRALLGCLSAFKDALVTKNMFDKTVIHIGSEFNRTPKIDASGSDHGFMGSAATVISGMVKKPTIIGNVQIENYNSIYMGTFGVAANFTMPSGEVRPLRINDVARTLSSMLGVDDVTTNGEPLMKSSDGKIWVPRREEANNV